MYHGTSTPTPLLMTYLVYTPLPPPYIFLSLQFVLKVALARLPNNPYLLTLLANFIIDSRRDGQAARTQLQLAVKANPSLLDRYFIFVAQETAKKLKSEGVALCVGVVR